LYNKKRKFKNISIIIEVKQSRNWPSSERISRAKKRDLY
jgi:hypothetical protein